MSHFPVPKDPVTVAIEKSIETAAESAQHYLDPLLLPGAAEGGGIIKDTIASWRYKNQVRLVLNMKRFLEERGLSPKKLLPKTAYAILEAGSIETESEMQERWATLLAAASVNPNSIPPAYPKILAELSSLEAKLLDWLFEDSPFRHDPNPKDPFAGAPSTTFQTAIEEHKADYLTMLLALTNLDRLDLIVSSHRFVNLIASAETPFMHLRLSPYGAAFIRACRRDCL